METLDMVSSWITDNLDSLFESYKKGPNKGFTYKPTKLDFIEEK